VKDVDILIISTDCYPQRLQVDCHLLAPPTTTCLSLETACWFSMRTSTHKQAMPEFHSLSWLHGHGASNARVSQSQLTTWTWANRSSNKST